MYILLDMIWTSWKSLWYERNSIEHGIDTAQNKEKVKSKICWKLEAIYNKRELLLSKDQDLLYDNIEEHTKQTEFKIQNWMKLYYPILKQSIKTAKLRSLRGVKSIKQYFSKPKETVINIL